MRNVSAELQAHLEGDSLTLAICVRISRRDGTVFGFTTSSSALSIDGVTYEALSSIEASAVSQKVGTGIDNLDVIGLLSSDRITDSDIRAGRYDGAEVLVFIVNYDDLTQGRVIVLRGHIGEITLRDGQYTAEVRSLTQRLAQAVGDVASPTCRARRLGDARCKLDMTGRRFDTTVATMSGDGKTLTFTGRSEATGYFSYGMVTMLGGDNADIERAIKSHALAGSTATILLQEPFPFAVTAGDDARLEMGCDRTWARCQAIGNAVNFQGEPHLPGNDKVLQIGRGD